MHWSVFFVFKLEMEEGWGLGEGRWREKSSHLSVYAFRARSRVCHVSDREPTRESSPAAPPGAQGTGVRSRAGASTHTLMWDAGAPVGILAVEPNVHPGLSFCFCF